MAREVFQERINAIMIDAISLGLLNEDLSPGKNSTDAKSWDTLIGQVGRQGLLLVLTKALQFSTDNLSIPVPLHNTSLIGLQTTLDGKTLPERYQGSGKLVVRDDKGYVDTSTMTEVRLYREGDFLVISSKGKNDEFVVLGSLVLTLFPNWLTTKTLVSRSELGLPPNDSRISDPRFDRMRFDLVIAGLPGEREIRVEEDWHYTIYFEGESIAAFIQAFSGA